MDRKAALSTIMTGNPKLNDFQKAILWIVANEPSATAFKFIKASKTISNPKKLQEKLIIVVQNQPELARCYYGN
ncbi:MAG: hypothetical protein HY885_07645 [Deltaproteobacteria bacterium]|nr:hypothetical protein [Deltaproteobacteria bacterium]